MIGKWAQVEEYEERYSYVDQDQQQEDTTMTFAETCAAC